MDQRKPMILVVDDEADNRAIMAAALAAAGCRVCVGVDGAEAVSVAVRERPDLILLDMGMPGVSGWEAVRRLKALPETRAIPVFAFTAFAMAGDEQKTVEAGCDGFIAKPCVPRDAVRKIMNKVGQ